MTAIFKSSLSACAFYKLVYILYRRHIIKKSYNKEVILFAVAALYTYISTSHTCDASFMNMLMVAKINFLMYMLFNNVCTSSHTMLYMHLFHEIPNCCIEPADASLRITLNPFQIPYSSLLLFMVANVTCCVSGCVPSQMIFCTIFSEC